MGENTKISWCDATFQSLDRLSEDRGRLPELLRRAIDPAPYTPG